MTPEEVAERHHQAFITPRTIERPMVNILNLLRKLILKHINREEKLVHADYLLVEEVVIPILKAGRFYINYDNGPRLDNGLLDKEFMELLDKIGVDQSKI